MGPAHRVIDWVTQHFQESEKSNVMFARYFYTASHLFQDGLKKAKKKTIQLFFCCSTTEF